jgi:glycerol-3-phosphate dehydrogenase
VNRNLLRLTSSEFDLVVIGGGIYGATAAWDAALRGLTVALIERRDFGHATSAQSLKVVHGGLRYLQNLDLSRIRVSDHERRVLMCVAPHLVHRLPVLLPTFRKGVQRRAMMGSALLAHELLSCDRNIGIQDPEKRIPFARLVSLRECLRLAPGLPAKGLTGGAVFYDGQLYNSERLTLSFVRSAAKQGACVANYVEAAGFIRNGKLISGVVATDQLTGQTLEIQARAVLNMAGPWVDTILRARGGPRTCRVPTPLVKTINVVARRLTDTHAIALTVPRRGQTGESRTGSRLVYIAPWRDVSIIGSAHFVPDTGPDSIGASDAEIEMLLDDVNAAYPIAALQRDDVTLVRCGLVPGTHAARTDPYRTARHHRIIDHMADGADGLFSVIGVKWTTARHVAQQVVSRVVRKLGLKAGPAQSDRTPLHDAASDNFSDFLDDAMRAHGHELPSTTLLQIVRNYGTAYPDVLELARPHGDLAQSVEGSDHLLRAQVLYAIRHEMARKLEDIVLRRTELAVCSHPGQAVLSKTAHFMAVELGWDEPKIADELAATQAMLTKIRARPRPADHQAEIT